MAGYAFQKTTKRERERDSIRLPGLQIDGPPKLLTIMHTACENPGSLGRQSEAETRATKLLKKEDEAACCSSVNSLHHHQNDETCLNVHFIPQIAKRVFLKSAGRFFVIRSGLRVSGFCYNVEVLSLQGSS